MYFNRIRHGYCLKIDGSEEERIKEYEEEMLFRETPHRQIAEARKLFSKYKELEKEKYVCPSCEEEQDGTEFDTRFGVCYRETCHPFNAWRERPATLVYEHTYLEGKD